VFDVLQRYRRTYLKILAHLTAAGRVTMLKIDTVRASVDQAARASSLSCNTAGEGQPESREESLINAT